MDNEKTTPVSPETDAAQENTAPPASQKKDSKGGKRVSKSRPVTIYLAVLFVAALLLLVMTFFMQQRSHQAIADLNQSMSDSQEVSDLKLELQQTQFQLKEAQDALAEAKGLESQVSDLEKQAQALEWLRQMEAAVRTSWSDAKKLVDQFEETGLAAYLPDTSVVEGQDAPAEDYRDIYAMFH